MFAPCLYPFMLKFICTQARVYKEYESIFGAAMCRSYIHPERNLSMVVKANINSDLHYERMKEKNAQG